MNMLRCKCGCGRVFADRPSRGRRYAEDCPNRHAIVRAINAQAGRQRSDAARRRKALLELRAHK